MPDGNIIAEAGGGRIRRSFAAVVRWIARSGKRIGVTIAGFTILAAGAVMLLTPGPGLLGIIAGLAILGTQYGWARRALEKARNKARDAAKRTRRLRRSRRRP
jgi:hypothetical protein